MARSTVHYADNETNNILRRLHNKLRPAGTPVQRVEYIIELLLLRIFEVKIKHDDSFAPLRKLFEGEDYRLLFSHLLSLNGEQILSELNKNIFPFYSSILSKSRKVVTGNLPQKMQDQLVLMEEVFANSNFTNNVKGGVVAEVIGLVNEIEEKLILKTDLLGDAIESALSETGGTKDVGLYRTPGHIRKMMVRMVDPDFTDTIFDPSCGTAGFLFDAYDYVIEKAKHTRKFPAENIANQFYRTGIAGIEYLGMIRKMAAINLYIRGLNPHNIEQGDSLAMYDPSKDAGSKTIVIANPPFGAERDQPAYPNVWEEYSKESETTILFVKLMFDLLKTNGRCAVIVSEGFLTWGQNSACALRKLLLNEANLRAVISLPQGVFVSKSGQGAKTSILYFEKGGPTDFVWFYKIENDGFSMGTNRKEMAGSQISELLTLFKEVKLGKKPKNTKQSFCVPREQIETLDPRMAERIRTEIRTRCIEKNNDKRKKLVDDLKEKIGKKKISKKMYDEKLWQFDNIVEGQIESEIAKAIERAHLYHLNLQNYRSNLTDEQIRDWKGALIKVEARNGSTIEKKYQELKKVDHSIALKIIASFDPQNALQVDIARDFLSQIGTEVLKSDETLRKLHEIIKETKKFSFESLGNLLLQKSEKIELQDDVLYKQITIKLYGKGVLLRKEILGEDIKTETQYIASAGDFIMSKIDARNGAFGIVPNELDGAIVSQDFPLFEINTGKVLPFFLELMVQTKLFYTKIENLVSGATGRRRTDPETFLSLQIPLPSLEIQKLIVEKIIKQRDIIEGAEQIIKAEQESRKDILELLERNGEKVILRNVLNLEYGSPLPENERSGDGFPVFGSNGIVGYHKNFTVEGPGIIVGRKGSAGAVNWTNDNFSPIDTTYYVKVNEEKLLLRFAYYLLEKLEIPKMIVSASVPGLNRELVYQISYDLPSIEMQQRIVDELDRRVQSLDGVRRLKEDAQKYIEQILQGVWGE